MSQPVSNKTVQDPYGIPIDELDVSDPCLYEADSHWPYFERLRKEAPVHYCKGSVFGPFWSVSNYEFIAEVDRNHQIFSSEPAIVIGDQPEDFTLKQFIAMDPPKHDAQRKAVTGVVAPTNLVLLEPLIRERVVEIMDSLPLGETFNWVDRVSIELTTRMLATLFDFPFERRSKLTYWSDMATSSPEIAGDDSVSQEDRIAALMECLEEFTVIWNERINQDPTGQLDFITLLAHSPATRDMEPMEYLGNLILLIVGGNDTTRNSISGGVLELNNNPAEYDKLRANPALIPSMVSEIIRYQTPLMHMRRLATEDTMLGGQQIKKGDKVVMWYVSGNRDEKRIERPNEFLIDRANPRNHLSFGFGIHRCMGNRLAEMQLRIVWEEIMNRFSKVEVVGEPARLKSNFVRGITDLPVRLHPL
ncbi:MAG: cytochrome P450 [bacterium]|nr:cytochrome P450 [Gammaproteobacteria bacterium]HIL96378.1 cytochrome P450 [Pseudomonadales bacterium]